MDYGQEVKEYTFGELVSKSWSIYQNKFTSILTITLLIYVPINIILYFVDNLTKNMNNFNIYVKTANLLETFIGIIATMGIALIVDSAINNNELSWSNALKRALSRWGSCFGTKFLAGLILIGLFILLIVPGIIWTLYYTFIVQVVVLKKIGGKEALDYSKSLVKGRWWKIFGIHCLYIIIILILSFSLGFIDILFIEAFSIFTNTIIDIASAFFTVTITVLFLNLDRIKESQDKNNVFEIDSISDL
ncbi:hypothetical protein [Wukongibacter sp. M2B1]|uniref:hypothetical protein n=1 Tax=Wukongibacter sp. M2B1 TaxID=3088895 RepID=UPI003D798E2E